MVEEINRSRCGTSRNVNSMSRIHLKRGSSTKKISKYSFSLQELTLGKTVKTSKALSHYEKLVMRNRKEFRHDTSQL